METTITVHDVSTGETFKREMDDEELQSYQNYLARKELESLAEEALATQTASREEAQQSGIDKLAALGLTPEEIAAITGAN